MVEISEVEPTSFAWDEPTGIAAQLRAVISAAEAHDGAAPVDEAVLLGLRHHGLDGGHLHVASGGFALVQDRALHLVVSPDERGQGTGSALLAAALAGSTDSTHGDDGDADPLTAWSHVDHPAAARLAVHHGFERVRELWVMRRSLADPLPATTPARGVRVTTFDPGSPTDAEDVVAVNGAAFASHPEQGALHLEGFRERMAEDWFDAAGLFLARDEKSGELLGFHWTKVHPAHGSDPAVGEVYVVGIGPKAQGRGLGSLLTLTGLHHLASLGLGEVILYVESDNGPARAVYERLGFTHAAADTHVQYQRG